MSLPDPRFTTQYAADYKGVLFHRLGNSCFSPPENNKMYLPPIAREVWCEPGYQQKRKRGRINYERLSLQ